MKNSIRLISILAAGALLSSCSAVYEDLQPCPTGLNIRAHYDHNMTDADAFASASHCAEAYVYGADGHFLTSAKFGSEQSVKVDLEPGDYHVIVYDGMDCPDASFVYETQMHADHLFTDVVTCLKATRGAESSDNLHSHFHAASDATVETGATGHNDLDVHMVKNTNNLRVVLQHVDGSDIDPDMFDFALIADNSAMGHDNAVVKRDNPVTYRPWTTGTVQSGLLLVDENQDTRMIENAYAEISFARLMADDSPTLHIGLKADERVVLDIPLVPYIEMVRSQMFATLELQDYLDRQDQYSIVFMLDPKTHEWIGIQIRVNDWDLIINNTDF